jgi:transcriptional regulator with XRE-family HTH domain
MTTLDEFGEYLKAARIRKELSLRAVESEVGISNAYLSQLEQGKIKQPSPNVLYKLSQLYDLSYKEVMRLVGYPVPGEEEEESADLAARIGPVTEEEEEELIDYLKFLRSRRKRED